MPSFDLTRPGNQKKQWTTAQLAYMRWLILPASAKQPATVKELAEQLGYGESTLRSWKHFPGFKDAMSKLALQMAWHQMPAIMRASFDNMAKPEGWQERVAFLRYVWPALHKLGEVDYFDEIENAADEAQSLAQPSVQQVLADYDPATRVAILQAIGKLYNLADGQNQPLEDNVELLNIYDVEKDLSEQPSEPSEVIDLPATPVRKQNRKAKRGYSKRNITPLR